MQRPVLATVQMSVCLSVRLKLGIHHFARRCDTILVCDGVPVRHTLILYHSDERSDEFPAYSRVLAKRLLSGCLLVSRVCRMSVRGEGRQARVCLPCSRPACVSMAVERRRREDRVTIPGFSTCHRCNGSGRVRYNK